MRINIWYSIFSICISFFCCSVSGGNELVINQGSSGQINVFNHISVCKESNNQYLLSDIPCEKDDWVPLDDSVLSGGVGYTYWFKMTIENNSTNHFLVIRDASIDYLDLYFIIDSKVIRQVSTGDARPYDSREINVLDYVFSLPNGSFDCYLRIKNGVDFKSPVFISPFKHLFEKSQNWNLLWGGYIGLLFVLIVYNIFIYLSTKEISIGHYVFYLFFLIVASCGVKGYAFQYLWPSQPYWNFYMPSFTSLYLIFMILFVCSLLQIKRFEPRAFRLLKAFIWINILTVILNLMGFRQMWIIIQISSVTLSAYLFFLGIKIYLKGHDIAKYFLLTWSLHLFLIIGFVMLLKGYLSYNSFLSNGLYFGSAIEAIFLSVIIAYKLKQLRIEKEHAEDRVIRKQEEQRLFLTEQAHEIQNPVYFVSNYIGVLDRNVTFLNELISMYSKLKLDNVDVKKERIRIQKFEHDVQIDVVKKELNEGLESVQIAINRVSRISRNLVSYNNYKQVMDINKCITETLSMIRGNLVDDILIGEHLGKIPMIRASRVQIEQVLVNLLKNAVEAIEAKDILTDESIHVRTYLNSNKIFIVIEDTGVGIDKTSLGKMFDRSFTTKSEGKGIGMGLCKRMIENHDGSIHIDSEIGVGTKLTIEIPTCRFE